MNSQNPPLFFSTPWPVRRSRQVISSCAIALALTLMFATGTLHAKPWWTQGNPVHSNDFLAPDVAFRASADADASLLHLHWVIADGYYLYQQKIAVKGESPGLEVEPLNFPKGRVTTDPNFGRQVVYFQQLEASAPYTRNDYGAHPLQIKVTYQGCAIAGLCYPPITKVLFPATSPPLNTPASQTWEAIAIGGGGLAFLLAGFRLRKGRKLATPAAT